MTELPNWIAPYLQVFKPLHSLIFLLWIVTLARAIIRWRRGRPSNRGKPFVPRLGRTIRDALAQVSLFRDPLGGIMHALISLGGVGLAICFVLVAHHLRELSELFPGMTAEAGAIHWLFDLFSATLLVGLLLSVVRRVTRKVPTRFEDGLLLVLLFLFALGAIASHALVAAMTDAGWEKETLYAQSLGMLFQGVSTATLSAAYDWAWVALHTSLLALMVLLPLTKLRHPIAAAVSLWMHDLGPPGRLDPVDLEREDGAIGARGLADLTRKELVDLDACTRCGRCAAVCPATQAGAALNPMTVLIDLAKKSSEPLAERIGTGALWACATCLACVDVCPVAVEPMRHLIDLRRERVLDEATFPKELARVYRGLERNGNPWGLPAQDRLAWAAGLDVPVLAKGEETDVLLWVGCLTAYDADLQHAARSLVRVLRAAGVEFATLGDEERCCGDPARRTGNEYLWTTLARHNVQVLHSRRFRRLVTLCPHGFNTLKNEYPAVGGAFTVMHAADLVAQLITEGKLPTPSLQPPISNLQLPASNHKVTYQDSCYLARGNGMIGGRDAVRTVLREIPGVELVEMKAHGRDALCCGGGGGQMWLDRPVGQRIESRRAKDVLATEASECLTACPYCARMLSDGLDAVGRDVRVRSWVELVADLTV